MAPPRRGCSRSAPLVDRVLESRGLSGESAREFLDPALRQLHDPSGMPGLDRAAERLLEAARAGEPIVVYGDYDVDGVTAPQRSSIPRDEAPSPRMRRRPHLCPPPRRRGVRAQRAGHPRTGGDGARVIVSRRLRHHRASPPPGRRARRASTSSSPITTTRTRPERRSPMRTRSSTRACRESNTLTASCAARASPSSSRGGSPPCDCGGDRVGEDAPDELLDTARARGARDGRGCRPAHRGEPRHRQVGPRAREIDRHHRAARAARSASDWTGRRSTPSTRASRSARDSTPAGDSGTRGTPSSSSPRRTPTAPGDRPSR